LTGWYLGNLIGVLRQSSAGYGLYLMEPEAVRLKPLPGKTTGSNSSDLAQVSLSGNDSLPGEPAGTATQHGEATETTQPSPTVIPTPTYYPLPLLISEVLPNPTGKEPDGEWVEIYNPTKTILPLNGVKLGDEVTREGKEGMLRFPDGYSIKAGEVLIIAHSAAVFKASYGFLPDFELSNTVNAVPDLEPYDSWGRSQVQLSNNGDQVLLVDPWDKVIDMLVYGEDGLSGFSPPVPAPEEGCTLERYPPEQDYDQAGDWRERKGGSPGRLDRSQPTIKPSATQIPSPSVTLVPTSTVTFTSTNECPDPTETISHTPTLTPSPVLSPSLSPTQADSQTPVTSPTEVSDGTSTPQPSTSPTRSPTPSSTEITPIAGTTAAPFISQTITPFTSATSTRFPGITDTLAPEPSATVMITLTPSPVLSATSTLEVTSPPGVLVNEIHADPHPLFGDANNDGLVSSDDDEFLELVNPGTETLDLSGWRIRDEVRVRFTFPENSLLESGCALVVFGGELQVEFIGGSQVFTAGSLGLNNSGDTIVIEDLDGVVQFSIGYGPEGGQDQSLTRRPDLIGELPLVLHSSIPEAEGALFSPGTRIDGSPFENCP
jgi:hypothetical protein